jgi:NodT family efflux transporter outer membrane factor (OMF) lipoprotein
MRRAPIGVPMLASLAACTVGPQHPTTTLSLSPPVASARIAPVAGPPQQIVVGAAVKADWWTQFGDPELDALVARALVANNDLANAEASLRQVREQASAAVGAGLPQVDASYQAQRVRVSHVFSNPLTDPNQYLYTLHTAQLSVSYPLDLFGAQRNKVRSARAAAAVAADRLTAARTTVIANLVNAVILQASLDAQIGAAEAAIRSNREILGLLQQRQALGDIGAADVAAQQTALATAESALPSLQHQRDHQRGLISTLIGAAPGSVPVPLPTLAALNLPSTLPVALPDAIVANRPDVRAAEAGMIGAAADVGTAIAARLPNIQLSATLGSEATNIADMFASGTPFWTLIGGVTQPIFHGGQLLHQKRAAEAALEGAKAQYRAAVLQAFLDVSDALSGLRTDADALDAAARAGTAADRNLGFVRRQLELGAVGTLALLNAEAADAQASSALVQAKASRLTDTVALYQSVGGGIPVR